VISPPLPCAAGAYPVRFPSVLTEAFDEFRSPLTCRDPGPGLARSTARRLARAATAGELLVNDWSPLRKKVLDEHEPYLRQRWIMTRPDALEEPAMAAMAAILAACPELAAVAASVQSFAPGWGRSRWQRPVPRPW
jgi:hypothetical protein